MELRNDEWELSEMVEHLSAELDEVSDTLAFRSQRRDATHSATTISLELNVTSRYDTKSKKVVFRSGQPGEQGLSRLKLELAPVIREQLQTQPAEVLRPRDRRPIEGVAPDILHKLYRLGIRTIGDLAELAASDAQRQALAVKSGLSAETIRILLRPHIERVVPEEDQWVICGHHFGAAPGSVVMRDRTPMPLLSWGNERIRVRKVRSASNAVVVITTNGSSEAQLA